MENYNCNEYVALEEAVSAYMESVDKQIGENVDEFEKEASTLLCYAMLANPLVKIDCKERIVLDNKYNMDYTKAIKLGMSNLVLDELCIGLGFRAREVLASNPTLPAYFLDVLSEDEDWNIRLKVVQNANTSDNTLKRMKNDSCSRVRYYADLRTSGIFTKEGEVYD